MLGVGPDFAIDPFRTLSWNITYTCFDVNLNV